MEITSSLRRGLIDRLGQERFDLWFGQHVHFEWRDNSLIVSSPDQFVLDRIRRRFRDELNSLIIQLCGHPVSPTFVVTPKSECPASPEQNSSGSRVTNSATGATSGNSSGHAATHRRYLDFESLVLGESNRLAVTAIQMVTAQIGRASPVLIYGPNGSGKTHLLEALLTRIRQTRCAKRSILVSAEQFTSHFLEALQGSSLPSFRRKYRDLDVLILDDIQFFHGKRATIVELQHTIDCICRNGRQVVLSADRAPGDLAALGPELMAKVTGGLVCGIDSLDFTMRSAIVRAMVKRRGLACPDAVCELVARELSGDGRQLSGAINRLEAASQALAQPVTLEFARQQLADLFQASCRVVRIPDIQRAVCEVYGLESSSLTEGGNSKELSEPRMLAMWLARKYTRAALSEIGQFFGGRSHSTVIASQKRMTLLMESGAKSKTKSTSAAPSAPRTNLTDVVRRVEQKLRIAN